MPENPNGPWEVRDSAGKYVTSYDTEGEALEACEEGQRVTYDHFTAQNPGPRRSPWKS